MSERLTSAWYKVRFLQKLFASWLFLRCVHSFCTSNTCHAGKPVEYQLFPERAPFQKLNPTSASSYPADCAAPLCVAAPTTSAIHKSFGIHTGMDVKEWLGFISACLYSCTCTGHQWSSHTVCQWQNISSAPVIEFLGRSVHWELLGMLWCLSSSQIKAGRQLTGRLTDLCSAKTGPWTSLKSLQHGKGKVRPTLCHKWLLQDSSVGVVNSAWQGIFSQIIYSSFSYKTLACFLSKSHVSYSHL